MRSPMGRVAVCLIGLGLWATNARGAEVSPWGPMDDYEARLEAIGREIDQARTELETLVTEVTAGDMGQVFIFIETPGESLLDEGIQVHVDENMVISRPLLPAEIDILSRGLPLEVVSLHLRAGPHQVSIGPVGSDPPDPVTLVAGRGTTTAWVATGSPEGVAWREE